jgi:recombination protein RecA
MPPREQERERSERQKALEATLSQIEKQFGKGSIMRLGQHTKFDIPVIPTGSVTLDVALGIGGVPRGRVVEIFGPESSGKTTLSLSILAEAQRAGGVAAFIDAEHALDPTYAKTLGVNLDDLLVSQPDTGEQALEIAESLVRSNAVDVVVIDSVAALVPRAEIEGEMGDQFVGLQARLMSQALRKLTAAIAKSKTCCVFINQIREKIGVMFGCFHYDARVRLANGQTMKIGKIVNQRLPLEVLSWDPDHGRIVPARIVDWHANGRTDQFLQFVVAKNGGQGRSQFGCTPDHLLLGEHGWRRAKEFQVDDRLMSAITYALGPEQQEVIKGSLLGDGSFRRASQFNTSLRIGHGAKQDDYVKWKQSLFRGLVGYKGRNSRGGWSFDTIPLYELTPFLNQNYGHHGKDPSVEMIQSLTPQVVAIWYMDDGTFDHSYGHRRCSIACADIPVEKRHQIARKLGEWGIQTHSNGNGRLEFGVQATNRLHVLVAPYVHPSMAYKLLPEYRGKFQEMTGESQMRRVLVPMPILKIYKKPKTRSMHRFDIEVEGGHSYFVDDVVVHNSPETTPGGRALKFYASVRIDLRRIETIKVGERAVGNRVRAKIVKNKVAPPFRQAEFDILFDEGISKAGSLLDVGETQGLIQRQGSWLSYGETKLGQGREAARLFLKENPQLMKELDERLRVQAPQVAVAEEVSP